MGKPSEIALGFGGLHLSDQLRCFRTPSRVTNIQLWCMPMIVMLDVVLLAKVESAIIRCEFASGGLLIATATVNDCLVVTTSDAGFRLAMEEEAGVRDR